MTQVSFFLASVAGGLGVINELANATFEWYLACKSRFAKQSVTDELDELFLMTNISSMKKSSKKPKVVDENNATKTETKNQNKSSSDEGSGFPEENNKKNFHSRIQLENLLLLQSPKNTNNNDLLLGEEKNKQKKSSSTKKKKDATRKTISSKDNNNDSKSKTIKLSRPSSSSKR